MIKTTIFTIATLTGLLLVPVGAQNVFGAEIPLSSTTLLDNPTVDAKAIPSWVDNNFRWYVDGQIDEKTLLTSMNWMFDNNIMHLSEKAAQEVADLREENEKLRALVEDTDEYRSGFFKPSEIKESSQKKSEATTPTDSEVELKNLPTRVDVRGWDPVKKQPIVGDADSQLTVDSINDFVDIFNMPDPNMMVCLPAVQNSEQSSCWIRVSQVHAGGTEDTPVDVRDFAQDNLDQFNTDVFNPDILNPDILNPDILNPSGGAQTIGFTFSDRFGVVVLCSTAMDKEIQALQAEVLLLEELTVIHSDDTTDTAAGDTRYTGEPTEDKIAGWLKDRLTNVEQKITSLQIGVDVCEEKISGDDALIELTSWPTSQKKDLEEIEEKVNALWSHWEQTA